VQIYVAHQKDYANLLRRLMLLWIYLSVICSRKAVDDTSERVVSLRSSVSPGIFARGFKPSTGTRKEREEKGTLFYRQKSDRPACNNRPEA